MSIWAATTCAISSSRPPSTWSRARSAWIFRGDLRRAKQHDQVRRCAATGVRVNRGMTHDGLGKYVSEIVKKARGSTARYRRDPARHRHRCGGQLPAGRLGDGDQVVCRADPGGRLRLRQLHPGVYRLAAVLAQALRDRQLPIIGDDIKSQVGATIIHRVLANLFRERGVKLDRTYQLNFGGNMDFYNMLERERLESKKISKTGAVTSQLEYRLPPIMCMSGPSDYVPWLTDRKWCLHPAWRAPPSAMCR